MDFGEVLSRAWKIIWKHKVLWIFGILASCGQGGGGGGGGGGGQSGVDFSGGDVTLPPWMENFGNNMEHFFNNLQPLQIILIIIAGIVISLILWFIFLALSTIGTIGVIDGTREADRGTEKLTFGQIFNATKPYFWRVLLFNFLFGLVMFVLILILVIGLVFLAIGTLGIALICIIPLICLMVPIGWAINVLIIQTNIAIVIEDLSIIDGLKRGWEVSVENIGSVLVMALILMVGGGIIGLILAVPIFMAFFPLLAGLIAGSAASSANFFGGGLIVSAICFISYLPVLILLNGILQTYIYSAWTLTYLRLTGRESSVIPSTDILEGELLDNSIPDAEADAEPPVENEDNDM